MGIVDRKGYTEREKGLNKEKFVHNIIVIKLGRSQFMNVILPLNKTVSQVAKETRAIEKTPKKCFVSF